MVKQKTVNEIDLAARPACCEVYEKTCEELSAYISEYPQVNEVLEYCVSGCYILPVPIPKIIKVPGPGELPSNLPD